MKRNTSYYCRKDAIYIRSRFVSPRLGETFDMTPTELDLQQSLPSAEI